MSVTNLKPNVSSEVRILKELEKHPLPSQPAVLGRLQLEMAEDEPDATRIERIISTDAGAVSAILRLANSSAYYRRRSVGTVREAIQVIGLEGVSQVAGALSIRGALDDGSEALRVFWEEASRCADVSAAVSLHPPFSALSSARAYVFGLLHDMGIAALALSVPGYDKVYLECRDAEERLLVREREEFNVDHAVMGFVLAERWGFPHQLSSAIRMHHSPEYLLEVNSSRALPRQSLLKMCAARVAELSHAKLAPERMQTWVSIMARCLECEDEVVEGIIRSVSS